MNAMAPAAAFLRQRLPAGGRVLCAVSGGRDSMCLLHYLSHRRDISVTAAHFDHRLRPTSGQDARFVRAWCEEHGIPCLLGEGDVPALAAEQGLSLEEAARQARYAFLAQAARDGGFPAVCTAHHARDNAETVLLNLLRGTGSAGLRGIPPERPLGRGENAPRLLRPFLALTPELLADYAALHALPHMEDETNASDDPARNRLRHHVLPVLETLNPRALENIARASDTLRREDAALESLARDFLRARKEPLPEGGFRLPSAPLSALPEALAERAVLLALAESAGGRRDLSAAHVRALLQLPEGGEASLPGGLAARRQDGFLTVAPAVPPLPRAVLTPGQSLSWGGWRLTLRDRPSPGCLILPAGPEPLTVAPLTGGERLALPGQRGGSRTVKRLCRDRGLDAALRPRLPGIYLGGRLAAVWPLGVDEAFLPGGGPCRCLSVESEKE